MANLGVALVVVILILFGGIGFYEYRETEKAKAKAVAFHIPEMPELPTFPEIPTAPTPEEEFELPEILEPLKKFYGEYKLEIGLVVLLVVSALFTHWLGVGYGALSGAVIATILALPHFGVFPSILPLIIWLAFAIVLVSVILGKGVPFKLPEIKPKAKEKE
jgi:hypothetical protein